MRKQLLSILLTLCMVVSLIPTAVYAGSDVQTETGTERVTASNERRALQLGMDAVTKGQHVYLGIWADVTEDYDRRYPIEWRVLDNETSKGGRGPFSFVGKKSGRRDLFPL